MANHYDIPSWAGKPPIGLHLDVLKIDKLIQKLMLDEKKCYLFGRNPDICDFCIDHASCSRVHAALVYHKHLNRTFLVDLGSTHGTYIGSIRLESNKPTQLPVDSKFHFGASTRMYILRERPAPRSTAPQHNEGASLLGLPETETELDNLTEFNTAHNRRITLLGVSDEEIRPRKRKSHNVTFSAEGDEVINPEDIDPSVGRFRNLVQSAVIPAKRPHEDRSNQSSGGFLGRLTSPAAKRFSAQPLQQHGPILAPSLSVKLGLHLPNPAPELQEEEEEPAYMHLPPPTVEAANPLEPKKKKYAKEAWPGKKPVPALLI